MHVTHESPLGYVPTLHVQAGGVTLFAAQVAQLVAEPVQVAQ